MKVKLSYVSAVYKIIKDKNKDPSKFKAPSAIVLNPSVFLLSRENVKRKNG